MPRRVRALDGQAAELSDIVGTTVYSKGGETGGLPIRLIFNNYTGTNRFVHLDPGDGSTGLVGVTGFGTTTLDVVLVGTADAITARADASSSITVWGYVPD